MFSLNKASKELKLNLLDRGDGKMYRLKMYFVESNHEKGDKYLPTYFLPSFFFIKLLPQSLVAGISTDSFFIHFDKCQSL